MSERVWIVDDTEMVLRMISDILAKHGYEVQTFNHPAVVLNRLLNTAADELPQVILVDYWMPDLNGDEVVRTIRQMGPPYDHISFVGITSAHEPKADEEYTKLGIFLLRKPEFHESDILIRVMRAQVERDKSVTLGGIPR